MKRLLIAALLSIGCNAAAQIYPDTLSNGSEYTGYLINTPGLSYNAIGTIDMSAYIGSRVSAQVLYSSVTFSQATFSDGSQSTDNITISSSSAIFGQTLTIGGTVLTGGVDFATGTSNSACATNLATAIAAAGLGLNASASGAIVYTTSTLNGTAYNYSIVSSTPAAMTVSTTPMTGGTNAAFALKGSMISLPTSSFTLGLVGAK